jgi:hypothetical protein
VKIQIASVDHAPDDLCGQLPLRGRLLRRIAGPPRRPEYWLAELRTPLSWTSDGVTRTIRHVVLAARWQGTSIGPGARIPVNISFVTDHAVLESESFDSAQVEYVAIGMIRISRAGYFWRRLWRRLFGDEPND